MRFGRVAAGVATALAVGLAGCGFGPGQGTSDVTLTVTRDFGGAAVASISQRQVPGSETVMRMLERSLRVSTRYGGGFVESINGLSGDSSRRDWFYYVNGVEAPKGAAATSVHQGDRIWWDLHDWSVTDSIPAVVGSFPEPFIHGVGGKRLPTTLECASDVGQACSAVTNELERIGVPVAVQEPGTGSGTDSLTVVVGTWRDLQGEIVAQLLGQGPRSSGVYAEFAGEGAQLELLDPHGHLARRLSGGAGLVAATAHAGGDPTWLITGTNTAGVTSAARLFTPAGLRNHFAVAAVGSAELPVPLNSAS